MRFAIQHIPNDEMGFDQVTVSATEAEGDPMTTCEALHRYTCPACGEPVRLKKSNGGLNWIHKEPNPKCPHSPLYAGCCI